MRDDSDHLGEEEGGRAGKRRNGVVEDGRRGERDRESSEKLRTACLEDVWECKCRGDGSIKERRSLARARRKRASTLFGTEQGRGQNEVATNVLQTNTLHAKQEGRW